MNYYDFFTFIVRIALANLSLLHNLTNDGDVSHARRKAHSMIARRKAHSMIANLLSIREVASRMVSAEAFSEESLIRAFDIESITGESDFVKLCMEISRIYETIEDGQGSIFSIHGKLDVSESCGSIIRTPQDLVKMVDRAISNHGIICKGCNGSLQLEFCNGETLGIEGMVL